MARGVHRRHDPATVRLRPGPAEQQGADFGRRKHADCRPSHRHYLGDSRRALHALTVGLILLATTPGGILSNVLTDMAKATSRSLWRPPLRSARSACSPSRDWSRQRIWARRLLSFRFQSSTRRIRAATGSGSGDEGRFPISTSNAPEPAERAFRPWPLLQGASGEPQPRFSYRGARANSRLSQENRAADARESPGETGRRPSFRPAPDSAFADPLCTPFLRGKGFRKACRR